MRKLFNQTNVGTNRQGKLSPSFDQSAAKKVKERR